MGTQEERERVRSAIRGLLDADRAADGLKPQDHYRAVFAGYGDVVAEEYAAVCRASATRMAVTPRPSERAPEAAPEPLEIDRVGPYRAIREIGRGGMGVVYLAEDTRVGRSVALKVLPAAFASSRHLQARFQREASIASRLDHPGICTVYEAGEEDGVAFIAMRYLEGETLAHWISQSREAVAAAGRGSGCVTGLPGGGGKADCSDVLRVVNLVEKVARSLHVAHEAGLIHRDVKPGNVMVTREGEPVLLDFGLAREEEDDPAGLTKTGSLMGTPAYMSPEQLVAQRIRLDRRTDVYSLGVALYEAVTLRLPFEAPTLDGLYQKILATDPENPRRLNGAVPSDLRVVLETALEKDRKRRYQTALDFAEDLRCVRVHEPIRARPVGTLQRLARWAQRNPAVAGVSAALLLSLVAGFTVSLRLLAQTEKALEDSRAAEARAVRGERDARDSRTRIAGVLAERDAELRRSRSLALAGASREAARSDLASSLLLAREAVRQDPRSEALSALQEALRQPRELVVFRGHTRYLESAVFSPDGSRILTTADDRTARLWDLEGRQLRVFHGHDGSSPLAIGQFSADGRWILTCGNGRARLRGIDGAERSEFVHPGAEVEFAVFSPDGGMVLTTGSDHFARVWDLDGKELARMPGTKWWSKFGATPGVPAAFSPDGETVLVASSPADEFGPSGSARLWDLQGRPLVSFHVPEAQVPPPRPSPASLAVEFAPDGKSVLTAASDGTVTIWSAAGEHVATFRYPDSERLNFARFSPDGRHVLTGHHDGKACLWARNGKRVALLEGHTSYVKDGVFSPDGMWILTCSADKTARVWDRQGRDVAVLRGHESWVHSAVFSPDGTRMLTQSGDFTARLWDWGGVLQGVLRGHIEGVLAASYSPDGTKVVTGSYLGEASARVWTADGREAAVLRGHRGSITMAEFSPDGGTVLTATGNHGNGGDSTARLWDLEGKPLAVLKGHRGSLQSAHFSPDGSRIVTCASDGTARLWNRAGECSAVLGREVDGERRVRTAELSPDGLSVLTAGGDAIARLWDLRGNLVREFSGHGRELWHATFSPDGQTLLTASEDGTARLWDVEGRSLVEFRGHEGGVFVARFSPAGDGVVTGSRDKTVRLWDMAGRELAVCRGHRNPVMHARFSRDGRWILSWTGMDGTARLWDLDGRERAVLEERNGVIETAEFSPDGRRVLTASTGGYARIWAFMPEDLLAAADRLLLRDFRGEERIRYYDLLGEGNAASLARSHVAELFGSLGSPEKIEERLRAGSALPPEVKDLALRLVKDWGLPPAQEAERWSQVGAARGREGNHAAAKDAYERAIAAQPDKQSDACARAWIGVAWQQHALKDYVGTRRSVEAALRCAARGAEALNDAARLLVRMGRYAEAGRVYGECERLGGLYAPRVWQGMLARTEFLESLRAAGEKEPFLVVSAVLTNDEGHAAEELRVGDRILQVHDLAVVTADEFRTACEVMYRTRPPGIRLLRGGEPKEVDLGQDQRLLSYVIVDAYLPRPLDE